MEQHAKQDAPRNYIRLTHARNREAPALLCPQDSCRHTMLLPHRAETQQQTVGTAARFSSEVIDLLNEPKTGNNFQQ